MNISLITQEACMPCKASKRKFDKHGIDFTEVGIDNLELLQQATDLGHKQTPVVLVHNLEGQLMDHWSGYNPSRIAALTGM